MHLLISLLLNVFSLLVFYFDFWPSLLCNTLVLILNPIIRSFVYEESEEANGIAIVVLLNIFWQGLIFFFAHIVVSKLGFIFVEAEIMRTGNE